MSDHGRRWRGRESPVPISTVLNFTPAGLVLGAGTMILRAERPRRLQAVVEQEVRVLALLSAAYGRADAPSVLSKTQRAAKAWCGNQRGKDTQNSYEIS